MFGLLVSEKVAGLVRRRTLARREPPYTLASARKDRAAWRVSPANISTVKRASRAATGTLFGSGASQTAAFSKQGKKLQFPAARVSAPTVAWLLRDAGQGGVGSEKNSPVQFRRDMADMPQKPVDGACVGRRKQ